MHLKTQNPKIKTKPHPQVKIKALILNLQILLLISPTFNQSNKVKLLQNYQKLLNLSNSYLLTKAGD